MKIGVFDSGIGGLTVARAIKNKFPQAALIYFGDTAHLPYGDKSAELIAHYAQKIMSFLVEQKVDVMVVACNSASAVLSQLQCHSFKGKPIINVVDPVVQFFEEHAEINKLGIIGTKATVNSQVYPSKLAHSRPNLTVHTLATPLLAPMIEEGFVTNNISRLIIKNYLAYPDFEGIDALLLACTHYPLIKKEVQEILPGVLVMDNADLTANYLHETHKFNSPKAEVKDHFYVSDLTESFKASASFFFGEQLSFSERKL